MANAQPGQVVVKTVTQEVLPASQAKERTTPEFWAYIENLKPSDWDRHILYVYRIEDNRSVPLEKCAGFMQLAGRQVPVNDREEMEMAIAQKYGGRMFRLILKRGSERVTETRIHVDAPPKMVQPAILEGGGGTVSEASATADVAKQAMSTIAGQERQAVDVAVNALRGAAEVVQRFSQQPAAAPASETDQMFRAVMVRMLEKMMNPPAPPDPLDLLTKVLTLQAQLNPGGTTGNPTIAKILDAAIEKLLNPPPAGPSGSASAELVRQLPAVASYVSQAMSQWRMGMEAQRDAVAIGQGREVPRIAPPAVQPPANNPTRLNPEPEVVPVGPGIEFVEGKIVEILREPVSAEEAAEDVAGFLDVMDKSLVPQLAALGEAGLVNLFQTRPALRPGIQNLPRLQDFIRAFLKIAAENADEPPKPN